MRIIEALYYIINVADNILTLEFSSHFAMN